MSQEMKKTTNVLEACLFRMPGDFVLKRSVTCWMHLEGSRGLRIRDIQRLQDWEDPQRPAESVRCSVLNDFIKQVYTPDAFLHISSDLFWGVTTGSTTGRVKESETNGPLWRATRDVTLLQHTSTGCEQYSSADCDREVISVSESLSTLTKQPPIKGCLSLHKIIILLHNNNYVPHLE